MKKAITIGVYNPKLINQASPYCGDQIFAKGLEANGYQVFRLDYREELDPDSKLIELSKNISPDLFWFGKCEKIAEDTIAKVRELCPTAIFCKWAADVRHQPTDHDLAHNKHIDWFFGTFAGDYLKSHLLPNMIGVSSILTFTDSSFYKAFEVNDDWKSDVLWTGRQGFGDNEIRNKVIDALSKMKKENESSDEEKIKIKLYTPENWLGNPEYLYTINGTKIGIGVNSFNRRKYSSDRLGNYMACGTFYLMHHIEGIEECFERGQDLDWFSTIDEMKEKINFYLSHSTLRNKIAQQGQKKVLTYFDYKPLLFNLLSIIQNKKSLYSWDEIYLN